MEQSARLGYVAQMERETALVYDLRATKDGQTRFFIVKIEPAKHAAYLEAYREHKGIRLSEFGEVLYMGEGQPSEELKVILNRRYGMYADETRH